MLLIAILIVPAMMSMQLVSASSGDSTPKGAVSGRVTTQDTSVGIASALVTIINASSGEQVCSTTSDSAGFFQFASVPVSGGSQYKLHASHSLFGEGYSNSFSVYASSTAPANVIIFVESAPTPVPSTVPDHKGSVCGRVTAGDPSTGAPSAYVAIILASDPGRTLYSGYTDANGYYQFAQVQDTWNSATGAYEAAYKVYAKHSSGEACSNAFVVEDGSVAAANVYIFPAQPPATNATVTPVPANHMGAVSGRVTVGDSSTGAPNAYVAIVLSSDPSQKLYTGSTDSNGFYQFAQVQDTWNSATGTYEAKYKVYAKHSLLGEGYSNPFPVEAHSTAPANVRIATTPTPAAGTTPTPTPTPTPLPDHSGAVSGRVTVGESSTGAPNAYVAIVLSSDPSQKLYTGSTDSNGFYQFAQVQDTWNSATGTYEAKYKVYAKHPLSGEGYSNPFPVEARSVAPANIRIAPTPTPAATVSPTPTHVPQYAGPINVTPNSGSLNVTGNMVFAPAGTSMDSVVQEGRIAMQVPSSENNTSTIMILRVSPVNNSTATIADASLVSRKEVTLNGRNMTVYASAELNGVPSNATLGIKVTAPEDADEGRITDALGQAGLNNSSKVLAVVEVIKGNLENGRDIKSGSLIITMPRPSGFDQNDGYKVIRESDGKYSLLDARLIGSPDADVLTFEILSPNGFSTFTLVALAAQQPGADGAESLVSTALGVILMAILFIALLSVLVYYMVFGRK